MDIGIDCCRSRLVGRKMATSEPSRAARFWYPEIIVSRGSAFSVRRVTIKKLGRQTLCRCQYQRPSVPNSRLECSDVDCTPADLSKRSVANSACMRLSESSSWYKAKAKVPRSPLVASTEHVIASMLIGAALRHFVARENN